MLQRSTDQWSSLTKWCELPSTILYRKAVAFPTQGTASHCILMNSNFTKYLNNMQYMQSNVITARPCIPYTLVCSFIYGQLARDAKSGSKWWSMIVTSKWWLLIGKFIEPLLICIYMYRNWVFFLCLGSSVSYCTYTPWSLQGCELLWFLARLWLFLIIMHAITFVCKHYHKQIISISVSTIASVVKIVIVTIIGVLMIIIIIIIIIAIKCLIYNTDKTRY